MISLRRFDLPGILAAALLGVSLVAGCSDSDPVEPSPEVVRDTIPPGRIFDIEASEITPSRVKLKWTAPGDDGYEGQAYQYRLYAAGFEITDENYLDAEELNYDSVKGFGFALSSYYKSSFNPRAPSSSGSQDSVSVWYLKSGLTYWFALVTWDEWFRNPSRVSANCRVDLPAHDHLQRAAFRNEVRGEVRELASSQIMKSYPKAVLGGYGFTRKAAALWTLTTLADPYVDPVEREDWGFGNYKWDGRNLYFFSEQLKVLDSAQDRQVIGSCALTGLDSTSSPVRIGESVYIAGYDSLCFVDMREPSLPQNHGFRYGMPEPSGYQIGAVATALLAWNVYYNSPLSVFNVSDPLEPVVVGIYDPAADYVKICLLDELVYVFTEGGEVQVVDLSNPSNPSLVGTFQLSDSVEDADISGGVLYTVSREGGLKYYSLANPVMPVLSGTCDVPLAPTGVSATEDLVFIYDEIGIEKYNKFTIVLQRN